MTEPVVTEVVPVASTGAVAEEIRTLAFADGFQFGCGFMAAAALGILILILLVVLLAFVLSLLGISLFDLGGGLRL